MKSKESVIEIMFNINTQMMGYSQDINESGLDLARLSAIIEALVNETSKLKTLFLTCKPEGEVYQ